ncbi:MAG: hypothetical protein M5R38_16925 [Candidatus Methylomirabilis sp.]|nr:hypothetical protein [Candidatus Methylomirabilis sp.]
MLMRRRFGRIHGAEGQRLFTEPFDRPLQDSVGALLHNPHPTVGGKSPGQRIPKGRLNRRTEGPIFDHPDTDRLDGGLKCAHLSGTDRPIAASGQYQEYRHVHDRPH